MTVRLPRAWPGTPTLLALAAAAFYGLTWSGRYVHDTAPLANRLDDGFLLHFHLAYLPIARGIQIAFSPLASLSAETAMGILSILSGVVAIVASYKLCRRTCGGGGGCPPCRSDDRVRARRMVQREHRRDLHLLRGDLEPRRPPRLPGPLGARA